MQASKCLVSNYKHIFYPLFNYKFVSKASRVIAIAQNLKSRQIKSFNFNLFSSLSFAFRHLINAVNDAEPIVAQKAISLIETLSDYSLKSICCCLQLQFDCVIADRTFIIQILSNLYTILSKNHQSVLTWDFFLQRFNAIYIETQLSKEVLTPADISGISGTNNISLQRKINMAKFALKRSDLIRPISNNNTKCNSSKQGSLKSEYS